MFVFVCVCLFVDGRIEIIHLIFAYKLHLFYSEPNRVYGYGYGYTLYTYFAFILIWARERNFLFVYSMLCLFFFTSIRPTKI